MEFESPLIKGTLVRRYKRFLADVLLEGGEEVTAHCVNSGALWGLTTPGLTVWLSPQDRETRKLKYTWELAQEGDQWIGVNTHLPNRLVGEALENGLIHWTQGYTERRREVKWGNHSRLDFCLTGPTQTPCWVEVKNVHMCRQAGLAEFPDSVTHRGTKHLHNMMDIVDQGFRAAMIYVVQRADCSRLQFAQDIDPVYAQTIKKAQEKGVEFYVYGCRLSPESIVLSHQMDIL